MKTPISNVAASKLTAETRRYVESDAWLRRSLKVIPSGTQTFSKGYTQYPAGACPLFLDHGKGSRVWDVDGNEYIDYPLALGPNILGYGNAAVDKAVIDQVRKGAAFSLPTPLEVEVAEMLVDRIPCAEMVRFGKNGSDATSAAVRVARAATGRDLIACCGYHGWQDWYIGTTTRSKGVPQAVRDLTLTFDYNKLDSLKALFDRRPKQIAGVIMEALGVTNPDPGFLEGVKELCRKNGAVLIFDEVVTGFRVARGGAQERFGVTPDVACFGKAMANGMPLSAVVGRRDVMEVFDEVFFSFTYGGDALALAACKATMLEIDRLGVYSRLAKVGNALRDGFNSLARAHGLEKNLICVGAEARTAVQFRDDKGEDSLLLRSAFQQEAAARGILFLVGHNVSAAISDADVSQTLTAYDDIFKSLKGALAAGALKSLLKGKQVQPIFRKP